MNYASLLDLWPRKPRAFLVLLCWLVQPAVLAADPTTGRNAIRVLPDSAGALSEIMLHYDLGSAADLASTYRDLFNHLDVGTQLKVICSSAADVEQFMLDWSTAVIGEGGRVQIINAGRPISIWARDRRIARCHTRLDRPTNSVIPAAVCEYEVIHRNDLTLGPLLAELGLERSAVQTELHLEGGNIVANNRHIFVGANVFEANQALGWDRGEMETELRRLLGRPLVFVQGAAGAPPWYHLDMYLTPLDDDIVLVGSPELAVTLLKNGASAQHLLGHEALEVTQWTNLASYEQPQFDAVAQQLASLGYDVVRSPVLVDRPRDWMVTYNNALLEERHGRRIAYMPVYEIAELDAAAARTYRSAGFEVNTVNVSEIFELSGALRCLVNVTKRSDGNYDRAGTRRRSGSAEV